MSDRQPGRAKVTPMAPLRDEHVAATRQALVAAARRHFGSVGFAATSLDDVVADAGVTKGALYHHFKNKEDLFVAVYEELEAELTGSGTGAAAGAKDAIDLLQRAFNSFLDLALSPEIQRISLIDAPSVLGAAQKHEIDTRYSLAGVTMAVQLGIDEGDIVAHDAATVAQLLIAACGQAAIMIATAEDHEAARTRIGAALDALVAGLRPAAPRGGRRPKR
jgi:AcrR family transcriptional regulator